MSFQQSTRKASLYLISIEKRSLRLLQNIILALKEKQHYLRLYIFLAIYRLFYVRIYVEFPWPLVKALKKLLSDTEVYYAAFI